ncbi:MAG: endonuclease Q family protein [Candidatus Hodarchaeota archaeon]
MDFFNCDLHIHSPHSIAVSKSLNLDTMVATCMKKGLHILGTGDILQPEWLNYMKNNLKKDHHGAFLYKNIHFILQTELEDAESIHHVVFFPDFDSVVHAQNKLKPHSKNILDEWGGRPRVNLNPPELVDIITDIGGLIGPAHAFTPFKAIFRQNKYENLNDCYQDATKNVYFLELGLSANTDLADRLADLKNISFLSNSDAHSQDPRSLGREFNKFEIENGSFEEILLALRRKNSRRIILNIGLHPKLGKYYNMFCNKCRRRVLFKKSKKKMSTVFNQYAITDNFIVYYSEEPIKSKNEFINSVSQEKIVCPACKENLNKNFKIKLGVSERIEVISSSKETIHPEHRPSYINAVPLIDIIRSVKGIKSSSSKTVMNIYNKIINDLGSEFSILTEVPLDIIGKFDKNIALVIKAIRDDEIEYTPGGGGTYGQIKLEI